MENGSGDRDADLESITDAIRILRSSPNDLILSADYKDVVYAALLEFEHEWRADHWWTPIGVIRTLGDLRTVQRQIERGEWTAGPTDASH